MKKRIDRLTMVANRLQVQSFCLQHVCKLKKEFNACKQAATKGSNLVKQKKAMAKDITYLELLLTERWRQKREQVLERDNRKCRNCGNGQNLQVHHRQYHTDSKTGMKREPWDYENKYLVTLCEKCHEAGHQQYQIPSFNN